MKQESAEVGEPDRSSKLKSSDAERGDLNEATAPAASPSPPFDPASLPPLQSITAGTDIRLFLGSNVPVELTKAALRRTWVTDPAIRDFVGIAENQWDFNDPTAMPGFGPLTSNDVSAVAGSQQALPPQRSRAGPRPTKAAVDAEAILDTRQIDEIDRTGAGICAARGIASTQSQHANDRLFVLPRAIRPSLAGA
jgi:hypothetical protein